MSLIRADKLSVKTFRRSYRALPAGPTSLDPTLSGPLPPDLIRTRFKFDLILTRKGGFRVRIGTKSGQNRVRIRSGFGGGRVQRGRSGWEGSVPKGPSRTKNSTGSKFTTARKKNATAIAKRYGECSEVLVFLRKRGRKTVRRVQNYGGSKILRIRAPVLFLVRKGPLGSSSGKS